MIRFEVAFERQTLDYKSSHSRHQRAPPTRNERAMDSCWDSSDDTKGLFHSESGEMKEASKQGFKKRKD